ncbi:mitochondrial ribosomal protein L21 (bL21m) [Andalucia godoyi]|uniref:Large ribosomal subunit protein bL21m n=1 Tax=Andalucia godoyi TaxID=505711 RepID=A0A8K0AGZ3_ANDGO|nr:mitochondrial ribosomal protein L21 (bL21m) [Andalucia godoyi]|eukprot:ANDGO_04358.mRNA.1 mitochondrial ribosomal protein L21 (bL21m)
MLAFKRLSLVSRAPFLALQRAASSSSSSSSSASSFSAAESSASAPTLASLSPVKISHDLMMQKYQIDASVLVQPSSTPRSAPAETANSEKAEVQQVSKPLMFAIVATGGKQYKVSVGDVILAEKLEGDIGTKITLDQVLMIGSQAETLVGRPLLPAHVMATIEEQTLADKEMVFKKRRRKNYRRTIGHRQPMTVLRIEDIHVEQF